MLLLWKKLDYICMMLNSISFMIQVDIIPYGIKVLLCVYLNFLSACEYWKYF
jgi:hypothetical protein